MNAFVRKEVRQMLPGFLIALMLTGSNLLWPDEPDGGWMLMLSLVPFVACPAACVSLALDSFGREFSGNTFTNLLAQPISRGRIWWTKSLLLLVALGLITVAWWITFRLGIPAEPRPKSFRTVMIVNGVVALVVYSGGLWTTLLFRQVAIAFWFTLLCPAAIVTLFLWLAGKYGQFEHGFFQPPLLVVALVAYSGAGFLLAWRLFFRAQDVHWTGGTIALTRWLRMPQFFVRTQTNTAKHPRLALLTKELGLHQSQLIIAGGLALVHLGMIASRWAADGFKDSPALKFLTDYFWVVWLVMPVLVGCAAVSEERRLGTLEAQFGLPVRRRTQFFIKLGVALALSVFFGVAVPALIEAGRFLILTIGGFLTGEWGITEPVGILTFWRVMIMNLWIFAKMFHWLPLPSVLLAVIGIFAISFYASSFSRNTLQSLAPAALGIVLSVVMLSGPWSPAQAELYHLWRSGLIHSIGVPVLTLTLVWLTYWNFNHVLVGRPVWRRNALVVFSSVAFVGVASSAIYNRAWEFLSPAEPPHGTPRLSLAAPPKLVASNTRIVVLLDDGRIWMRRLGPMNSVPLGAALTRVGEQHWMQGLLAGTNWSDVAVSFNQCLAVRADGSLWDLANAIPGTSTGELVGMKRFGTDSDWKQVSCGLANVLALKLDGTLWGWGLNSSAQLGITGGKRNIEAPVRIGMDSNWAAIYAAESLALAVKADGSVWRWGQWHVATNYTWRSLMIERPTRWEALAPSKPLFSAWNVWFGVVVGADGGLWGTGPFPALAQRRDNATAITEVVRLGRDSDWRSATAIGQSAQIAAVKQDGSLWKSGPLRPADPSQKERETDFAKWSNHSDWLSVTSGDYHVVVLLSADGSLWGWNDPDSHYGLLAPPRKPVKIANIFE